MHAEFADWYRSASLTPTNGLIQKRWDGVDNLATTESVDVLLSLLRLYVLPTISESACPPEVRAAFRKHDETFPASGNLEEMRVLGGAVLRQMFESRASLADAAALGILAGCFPSRSNRLPTSRHLDAAEAYAVRTSMDRRRRETGPRFSLPELSKKRFEEVFTPAIAAASPADHSEPLRALLNQTRSDVREAANAAITSLEDQLRTKEEELDYLWWLTAAHSSSLTLPFSEVGPIRGALVYPTELARLTAHVPGPASAISILLQALLLSGARTTSEPVVLSEAVNAVDRLWREQAVEDAGDSCRWIF